MYIQYATESDCLKFASMILTQKYKNAKIISYDYKERDTSKTLYLDVSVPIANLRMADRKIIIQFNDFECTYVDEDVCVVTTISKPWAEYMCLVLTARVGLDHVDKLITRYKTSYNDYRSMVRAEKYTKADEEYNESLLNI